MNCSLYQPVVFFEHDTLVASFVLSENGEPFDLNNYRATFYVVIPSNSIVMSFPMTQTGAGILSLNYVVSDLENDPSFQFETDVCYRGQIYLEALTIEEGVGLGLYDIVDPDWMDYIPPADHICGWFSGVQRKSRTALTDIPVDFRQSFRLLGA